MLCCFPLKPRLQRLFVSRYTAKEMKWHQEKCIGEEDILRYPADGEAWKDFDKSYPWFAQDPRNVRLGLASDGFNPLANMYNSYNIWLVMLVPYNMPPQKCMKQPFLFMSLLIPGPNAPRKDIDAFLRPLIDELKELQNVGVENYDASTQSSFKLHATVLQTINDFPVYGNLSGRAQKVIKLVLFAMNKHLQSFCIVKYVIYDIIDSYQVVIDGGIVDYIMVSQKRIML